MGVSGVSGVSPARWHALLGPVSSGALGAAVCAVVWVGHPTQPGTFLPPCPTKLLVHIDCPGCGATRALYSLLHGDLGAALGFNALAVVVFLALAIAYVGAVIGAWRGRPLVGDWTRWRFVPPAMLVVALVWFVIRNIPVAPFTALRV